MKFRNNQKCRRWLIAFCVFFIHITILNAGTDSNLRCTTEKNIATGKFSLNGDINSFIDPPNVYFFTAEEWESEKRILKICSINTLTSTKDSFNIEIPESVVIHHLPEIAINNNYLILTDDNYLDIYRYKKINKTYRFTNEISLPKHSKGKKAIFLTENTVLLHSNYNYHPNDETFNTNLGIYDVKNDKIIKFIHPYLPCIGFSHLANSWIAVSNKLIALAYPCGYKIMFYDFNLNKIDSIDYHPKQNWMDLPKNTIPIETSPAKINPKLLIEKILVMQDTISRIEKIFFLNDTVLMVSSLVNNPENTTRRIDLFRLNNLQEPFYTDEHCKNEYSEEDTIHLNNRPLHLYYPSKVCLKNNILYSINSEDFQPPYTMLIREFNHLKDLYYEKYDPQFSIGLLKITLP